MTYCYEKLRLTKFPCRRQYKHVELRGLCLGCLSGNPMFKGSLSAKMIRQESIPLQSSKQVRHGTAWLEDEIASMSVHRQQIACNEHG